MLRAGRPRAHARRPVGRAEPYLDFAARYPIVLNGRVRDPEYRSSLTGLRRRRVVRGAARRGEALRGVRSSRDYQVFERLADVSSSLLESPELVVERLLPHIEGGLYHLHMYQFLGDGERCARISSRERVFKADASTTAHVVGEPHTAARAWREELGLDYGKIDYTLCEGEVILLDANKTIGSAAYLDPGVLRDERQRQAKGIHAYFAGLNPL